MKVKLHIFSNALSAKCISKLNSEQQKKVSTSARTI